MNDSERVRLMHAALDGEATEAEARELDRLLAAEPTARMEFEHLRRLFEGLSRVPKAFPPEGLVAAVMANIPQNLPPQGRLDQLSLRSRVIGLARMKARGTSPGKSATDLPAHQPGIYLGEWKMSEQSSSLSRKRNVLIGGGIAIAAALFALSYTIDFPAGVQNTVGTIVPAQRFHAAQPTADEIKVGGQAAAQPVSVQTGSAANAASSNAINAATVVNSVNTGTTPNSVVQGTSTNAMPNSVVQGTSTNATANSVVQGTSTNAMPNAIVQGTTMNATPNAVTQGATLNATTQATTAGTSNAVLNTTTNATSQATTAATNKAVLNTTTNAINNSTTNAINSSNNNATAK